MNNIDEKIAKMVLKKRIEKEEKNIKENLEKARLDQKKITLEEICEGIRKGEVIIHDKKFDFKRELFFNGKLDFPVPDSFFEIRTNTDKNVVILNDPEGVSFNGEYIAKCTKKQDFKVIKNSIDKNLENAKIHIEWIDEGKFKLEDSSTVFFASYKMPTSKGQLYNLFFMRDYKGTVMIGNYNCMENNTKEWKCIIDASIREMKFL